MTITEANPWVAPVHDRMPALPTPDRFDAWLSGEGGLELLSPAPDDFLQRWPVSRRVNSSRTGDEDSTLIEGITAGAA